MNAVWILPLYIVGIILTILLLVFQWDKPSKDDYFKTKTIREEWDGYNLLGRLFTLFIHGPFLCLFFVASVFVLFVPVYLVDRMENSEWSKKLDACTKGLISKKP